MDMVKSLYPMMPIIAIAFVIITLHIAIMSGQPIRNIEIRAFESFMALIKWLFGEEDPRNKTKFSDKMIEWYRESGSPDWLEFYNIDIETAANGFQETLGSPFGISEINDESDIEAIAEFLEGLLHIIETEFEPSGELLDLNSLTTDPKFLLSVRAIRISLWCILQYKCSIGDLLEKCKEMDTNAMLKMIKLDSTFLSTELGRRFLSEMELQNNLKLRKKVAQSINSREGFWKLKGGKVHVNDFFALSFMSQIGFQDRQNPVWAEFLSEHGFDNLADAGAVKEARKRCNLKNSDAKGRQKNDDQISS